MTPYIIASIAIRIMLNYTYTDLLSNSLISFLKVTEIYWHYCAHCYLVLRCGNIAYRTFKSTVPLVTGVD